MSLRRLAAVSLVAGVLLAGCSDDAEPRFEAPSSSPSPSEAESSDVGQAQTPEEFIREWFAAGTEMQNTGDVGTFREMSARCRPCEDFATRVETIYERGGFISIEKEAVEGIEPIATSRSTKQFTVLVTASPTRYKEASDAALQRLPGGRNEYRVTIIRRQGTWRMQNYLDTPT